jgi:hypothetical protein
MEKDFVKLKFIMWISCAGCGHPDVVRTFSWDKNAAKKYTMTFEKEFNDWMTRLNKTEKPGTDIVAFNYGLFETAEGYTIYLIGAKEFHEDDEDWATEVDFEPNEKYLPINPNETKGLEWNQVLDKAVDTITKYIHSENFKVSILKDAEAITTGFDDGDITRIK